MHEFNFQISTLIQAITNCEPKDITDLLKSYMYAQKFFNPAITLGPGYFKFFKC